MNFIEFLWHGAFHTKDPSEATAVCRLTNPLPCIQTIQDGITGCKTVYMRRGQPEGFAFGRQQHPKRVTFVMDISGSMCLCKSCGSNG
jgi:hypothetical protein